MDLPEIVVLKIFNFLPFHHQLTSARLICKKWKLLAEHKLVNSRKELVLFVRMRRRPLIWSHNQQPVNLANSLYVESIMPDFPTFLTNCFANVQRLYIARFEFTFDEDEISRFVSNSFSAEVPSALEHLEVNNLYFQVQDPWQMNRINVDLRLPKLQSLFLGSNDNLINLDCPALTHLCVYDDAFHLDGKFSLTSLRILKVRSFSHESGHDLPNLEVSRRDAVN